MKPLDWIGSSYKDLFALPKDVQKFFGFALSMAQEGKKHDAAKVLNGTSKNPIKMDESVFCLKVGSLRRSGILARHECSSSKGAAWRPDVGQVCPTYRVRNLSSSDPKFPKRMFLETP
jgi:hypothetical protein